MSYTLQVANGESNTFTDILSTVFTAATYEMEMLRPFFTDYSGFLSGGGRVVQVPVMPKVSVAAHTDGTTVSAQNPAIAQAEFTTNIYAGRVDITDYFEATSEIAIAQWAGRELARGYMEEFETVLASAFDGFAEANKVTFDNTAATPDIKGLVSNARSTLRKGRVFGQYFGVLPVDMIDSLRDQITPIDAGALSGIGERALVEGNTVGPVDFKPGMMRLFGVNLMDSSVLGRPAVPNTGTEEVGAFFSREAIGMAEKRSPSIEIGRVTGELADRIVISGMFGAGVVDDRYGFKVQAQTA